ncbi:MAG: hypothetical protein JNL32_14465 [Candidatus Kapabacteria bacterium]|nr:hypothetical protein [Candidatus Kapabacteria bacterium]
MQKITGTYSQTHPPVTSAGISRCFIHTLFALLLTLCISSETVASLSMSADCETATEALSSVEVMEKIITTFPLLLAAPPSESPAMAAEFLSITNHAVHPGHPRINEQPPRI